MEKEKIYDLKHYGSKEEQDKAHDFGLKLAQAMVDNLNKETTKESKESDKE